MLTNCFCLCSPEASEAKWKKKAWNLSAFPSALEVRRVQRGRTSGVTESSRFHQQEVRCLWVSGVWDGGGRVDTCKPLVCFPDASHRNGTCWWDVLVRRLPHIYSEQNLPSSRLFSGFCGDLLPQKYSVTSHNRPKCSVKCQAEYYDFSFLCFACNFS